MDSKEEEFINEYENLLRKYNVVLKKETWSDEYGNHSNISFIENGKYCNINYCPDVMITNLGRRGMGS